MQSSDLFKKCLFVVTVPLTFQIAFIFVLTYYLFILQSDIKEESQVRTFRSTFMTLERRIIEDLSMIRDRTIDADVEDLFTKLDSTLRLVETHSNHKENVRQLRISAARVKAVHEQWRVDPHKVKDISHLLLSSIDQFMADVGAFVTATESDLTNISAHSAEIRKRIEYVLMVAVPTSLVVAAALAYVYAISISNPMHRMAENSKLLALQKPLPPVIRGETTFSELDLLLHRLADAVNETVNREISTIENSAELICTLDYLGVFSTCNRFAEQMLHMPPANLVGKSLADITVPSQSLQADEEVRKACSSEAPSSFELKLLDDSGTELDTNWSCFWSAQSSRLFCIAQDVTEQKRIAQMKEDFFNMISHDLRSPLTSMMGSMSLLSAGAMGELTSELRAEVDSTSKNIQRLISLINDILDFQKLEAGKMQLNTAAHDLSTLIDESVALVQTLAESKKIKLRVSADHVNVQCDGQKLVQALSNLISNAIKFAPTGSTVTIATGQERGYFQVSVTDRGVGVPDHLKGKIFEAFEQVETANASKEGTGLGLAIAKLIMDAHGGEIGVTNNSEIDNGSGSTFWIQLPEVRRSRNVAE